MKRIISICLILCIVASIFSVSSLASEVGESAYSDVAPDAWYFEYVDVPTQRGAIQGVGNGKFDPDSNMTCAQFMKTIVAALIGIQSQDGAHWADNYMAAAYNANLSTPEEMPRSVWDTPMLRQDIARVLSRTCDYLLNEDKPRVTPKMLEDIKDYSQVPALYKPYMAEVFAKGLYIGNNGNVMGNKPVTRAECAAILARLIDTSIRQPWVETEFVFNPAFDMYPASDPDNAYIMKPEAVAYYSMLCVDNMRIYQENDRLMLEAALPELPISFTWYIEAEIIDQKSWTSAYKYSVWPKDMYIAGNSDGWQRSQVPDNGYLKLQLTDKPYVGDMYENGYIILVRLLIFKGVQTDSLYNTTANFNLQFSKHAVEQNSVTLTSYVRDNYKQTTETTELPFNYKRVFDFPELWD